MRCRQDVRLADQGSTAVKLSLPVEIAEAHSSHVRELAGFCFYSTDNQACRVCTSLFAYCEIFREVTQIPGDPLLQRIPLVFAAFWNNGRLSTRETRDLKKLVTSQTDSPPGRHKRLH